MGRTDPSLCKTVQNRRQQHGDHGKSNCEIAGVPVELSVIEERLHQPQTQAKEVKILSSLKPLGKRRSRPRLEELQYAEVLPVEVVKIEEANPAAEQDCKDRKRCRKLQHGIEVEQNKNGDRDQEVHGAVDPSPAKVTEVGAL